MCGTAPPLVTRTLAIGGNTFAPSVAPAQTTPSSARWSLDLLIVNTPFVPDEWEKMLNNIKPFNRFSDVPTSLRSGFNMGVHSSPLFTYTPPNHNSALQYPEHVLSHIHNELSLHRYSSPFFFTFLFRVPDWSIPNVPTRHRSKVP
jgi:hypothetical protein